MKIFYIALITLILLAAACKSSKQSVNNVKEIKEKDVAYGSFASSKMDVYLPKIRNEKTPFVVMIHGGAWTLGDKVWFTQLQDTLLAHNIASVNINYRFVNETIHYDDLLNDIDSAINYCVVHASEWNIRSDGFTTLGSSAGGHLALSSAYHNNKIKNIVNMFGPTNFTDTAMVFLAERINMLKPVNDLVGVGATNKNIKAYEDKYKHASPIYNIKNKPVITLHGTADEVVPYSQAVTLKQKLDEKNIKNKLVTVAGAHHDLDMNNPATWAMVCKEITSWIWLYGK